MKKRNLVLCIVFTFITCGIYSLYWFVVMTNEINRESQHENQTSGGVALILTIITLGIYGWYWLWKMGEKCDILKNRYLEYTSTDTRVLYLVLSLINLDIVNYALIQYELNRAIDLKSGGGTVKWTPAN